MASRVQGWGLACALLPLVAVGGSLRVGPTRIDLSPRHPVAVLQVQNTGDSETLAQIDTFTWTQHPSGELLVPTTDLLATPLVLSLAPGESRSVRVGLRDPITATVEQSYRLVVGEVVPTALGSSGLRFAVRISCPVFAQVPESGQIAVRSATALSWAPQTGLDGCARIMLSNKSGHHEHLLQWQLLAPNGELLWQSMGPDYVLAQSQHPLSPQVCAPRVTETTTLRLTMESGTITLPPTATGLFVEAK